MKTIKILNLYAGLGGNRKNWQNVEVTAVEINQKVASAYSQLYPSDTVIVTDAHKYLIKHYRNFDFIWSSPPCQTHSKMNYIINQNTPRYPDLKLYEEIIFLKQFSPVRWVIENVKPYYTPLVAPSTQIGRHLFWSNFDILPFEAPQFPKFIEADTAFDSEKLKQWLGISYRGNIYIENSHNPCQVLRNCVHPDLGQHIFNEFQRLGLFQFQPR